MPSTRVKSPKDVVKVRRGQPAETGRRLPQIDDTLQLTATVTRVDPHDADTRWDKITVKVRGYPIPVTLHLRDVYGDPERPCCGTARSGSSSPASAAAGEVNTLGKARSGSTAATSPSMISCSAW